MNASNRRRMMLATIVSALVAASIATPLYAAEEPWGAEIRDLLSADRNGVGQSQAAAAYDRVVAAGLPAVLPLLRSADEANPIALNWILSAVDRILADARRSGAALPRDGLQAFVSDRSQRDKARFLAWDWLRRIDATSARQLVENMLDDPAGPLRREAVELRLAELPDAAAIGAAASDDPRREIWRDALNALFHAARDRDQLIRITDRLRALGESPDTAAHYGYVRTWHVVGPFDNTNDSGFDRVYPPEERPGRPDLSASFSGKHGNVAWREYVSHDEVGLIDLNAAVGEEKGVVAYAAATVISDAAQSAQIRVSTPNSFKLWVNGEAIASYHVYHSGFEPDQYTVPCRLNQGENLIFIKVCQNEQTQDWAKPWAFQLRVCDALGGGVIRP
ncbi:hypothetical protein [Thermopirellula anaerolimosa]